MYFSRIRLKPDIYQNTQLAKVISQSPYGMHRLFWDLFTEEKKRNFIFREEIAREQLGSKPGARGEPIYYVVSSTQPKKDNPLFMVDEKPYQPKLNNGDRLRFELRANPVVTCKVARNDNDAQKYLKERKNRKVDDPDKLTKRRIRHDLVMHQQKLFMQDLCSELNLEIGSQKKSNMKQLLVSRGGTALGKKLTNLLKEDARYADRLEQPLSLRDRLEWAIKAKIDNALEQWILSQGQQNGFSVRKNRWGHYKIQNTGYRWNSLQEKAKKEKRSGFSSVDFTGEIEIIDVELFRKALFEGIGRSKAFGCGLLLIQRA